MKWITLLALLVSPLVNAITLDELQQRFAEQPVVRAHFEQTRTIKDMPQPLRSQGELVCRCGAFLHFAGKNVLLS